MSDFAKPARKRAKRFNPYLLTLIPIYIFTFFFVLGPLIYMFILSFLTRGETWGVVWDFTAENYANIFEPVYLETFWESLKLAFISTGFVILLGYPFGYFMAKLTRKWKSRMMMFLMVLFISLMLFDGF